MSHFNLSLVHHISSTLQGRIFEAKDEDDANNHTYVVKEALSKYVTKKRSIKGELVPEDFIKERRILLSLNGFEDRPASIVKAIASWNRVGKPGEEDAFLLMMEKVPGREFFCDIQDFTSAEPHDDDELAEWQSTVQHVFGELCEAVAWLHSKNIVHLDISPENLLFGRVGDEMIVRLIDFGLAEVCDDGDFYLSVGSRGKFQYMAPEVIQPRFRVYDGSKADVWSMGMTLLCALTGKRMVTKAVPRNKRFTRLMEHGLRNLLQTYKIDHLVPEPACDLMEGIFKMEEERMSAREMLAHPYLCGRIQSPVKTLSDDPTVVAGHESGNLSWMTDGVHSSMESLVDDDLLLRLDNESVTIREQS